MPDRPSLPVLSNLLGQFTMSPWASPRPESSAGDRAKGSWLPCGVGRASPAPRARSCLQLLKTQHLCSEQGVKSRSLEVTVVGERLGDRQPTHHDERNLIDDPGLPGIGPVVRGAVAPVPRISTKSGPFSPGEWLES